MVSRRENKLPILYNLSVLIPTHVDFDPTWPADSCKELALITSVAFPIWWPLGWRDVRTCLSVLSYTLYSRESHPSSLNFPHPSSFLISGHVLSVKVTCLSDARQSLDIDFRSAARFMAWEFSYSFRSSLPDVMAEQLLLAMVLVRWEDK